MSKWLLLPLAAACTSPPAIELPGARPGIGFDDLRYSARLHRVLVPGGRSGNLALVDPDTHDIRTIGGFSTSASFDAGGHDFGITSVDDLGSLLAVSDRTSGKVSLVDVDRMTVVAEASVGGSPDYLRWIAATSEIWVSEPSRERIEVFSVTLAPPSIAPVGTIAVPGGPESLVIDQSHGRAFTHLWNGGTVAVDVHNRTVGATWSNGCNGSRGIAIDEDRGFVFAACAEGRVAVLDAKDGHVVGDSWVVDGVDVIDFSPSRRHLYAPGQISANLGIFGVSTTGALGVLAIEDGTLYGHCVTTDDAGHAFVCDPRGGRLLVDDDNFDPITR
jgi:DNA-binding beta-propeller fold protein YncE